MIPRERYMHQIRDLKWNGNRLMQYPYDLSIQNHYEKPVLSSDTLFKVNCSAIRQKNNIVDFLLAR